MKPSMNERQNAVPKVPTKRLFFALWPDEPMQAALAEASRAAVRASEGQPVPWKNYHLTLAFLGSVRVDLIDALGSVAGRVAQTFRGFHGPEEREAPPEPHAAPDRGQVPPRRGAVTITVDRIEHWRKQALLCATPSIVPEEAAALAHTLQQALVEAGFSPDLGKSPPPGKPAIRSFRAHVTLARKVRRRVPEAHLAPLHWEFGEFALIQSETLPQGSVYTVLERYRLHQAA
jgi:2'-5' RNA ligase